MPETRHPQSLRGLAHPLRVRILRVLHERGASTATRLAGDLGESSGATSYHLRQLAGYGFVEEDEKLGRGRERWWRVAGPETAPDQQHAVAVADFQRVQDFLSLTGAVPPEWSGSVALGSRVLRITPAEATEMLGRIDRVLADYPADRPGETAPADTARVVFQWQSFPQIR
ncbi:winged helix-turn-helix domain-containing protein [Actinoplanes sp. DH11]|uniref:winged helix-turn-helix domain-containing protein n=1 Tax=Actinoplanes sp. DH11 TaxID=2857011 RepID=UPI001E3132B8|nr:winged helix-turn-helix domain-containing protein [Actinoplanes sp. DH11]